MRTILIASLLLNLCLATVVITMATVGDAAAKSEPYVGPQQVRIAHQPMGDSDDKYPPVQEYQYRGY